VVTDPLGVLLIAERAALLAGRDDEFVALVLMGFTGMRWGEIVGLEAEYAHLGSIRVEWPTLRVGHRRVAALPTQGRLLPHDRHPAVAIQMVSGHLARTAPTPCACHGRTYVFRGLSAPNGAAPRPGANLVDVARRAKVSTGTVSNVLNGSARFAENTRVRVKAIADLGYIRGGAAPQPAVHWRRTEFTTWLFQPAAPGWYPKKSPQPARPVPMLADPWPGVPARGRGASGRAETCWMPTAPGLTPHGLHHSHRTLMEDMRTRFAEELARCWESVLDARLAMSDASPVIVLDKLLQARARRRCDDSKIVSPISPHEALSVLGPSIKRGPELRRGGGI
jgi:integrase